MNTKKTKKSPVAAACSALGTALLILLIVICLPLTVPKAFHYHVYTVISGSMEPAIPTGSLVYIKEMEPKDVQVDDVIAFYGTKDAASIITHRVVENRVLMGEFITKGDANATKDAGLEFVFASYGFGNVDEYQYKIEKIEDLLEL